MKQYEIHPIAEMFPHLPKREFAAFVRDIVKYGLIEPITLYQDKVLDGKIRYLACLQAGIKPRFQQLAKGENPIDFIISANLRRLHLPPAERSKFKQSGKLAEERKHDPIAVNFFFSKNLYRRHLPLRQLRSIETQLEALRGN
jgi:hypothetical protein